MFNGALSALITPFRDGEVDERALRDLIEWQIQAASTASCHADRPANRRRSPMPSTSR